MRQIAPPSVSLSDEPRTTATTDGPTVHGPDPDRLQIESHRFCPAVAASERAAIAAAKSAVPAVVFSTARTGKNGKS